MNIFVITFKNKEELKKIFNSCIGNISENNIVFSCGSGVTACVLSMAYSLISDKHAMTGSMSTSGSFTLNGYIANEISNDETLNDDRSDSMITENAGRQFFSDIINNSAYLRKKFAKVASSITSTTASFTAVSASAPEGLASTTEEDFMFFNNGMIIEYDALKVMQKGSTFELHIDDSNLGYELDSSDEVVAWGKFNS